MESMEALIQAATEKVNGVQTPQAQVPAAAPQMQVAQPAPGCVLTPGWAVHPYDNTVEYQGTEWRKMQVQQAAPPALPAPVLAPPALPQAATPAPVFAPPPMVQAPVAVAAPPPIVQPPAPVGLPPIVAVAAPVQVAPLLVGPDGLPPGSINPPEARSVADKLELSPVTAATGAKDDLDLMNKEQLQTLAASMGIETARLREAGLKDRIRDGRIKGVVVGTMPSGAPVVATRPSDDTVERLIRAMYLDRVTRLLCAVLNGEGTLEQKIQYAKQVADQIEKST